MKMVLILTLLLSGCATNPLNTNYTSGWSPLQQAQIARSMQMSAAGSGGYNPITDSYYAQLNMSRGQMPLSPAPRR